MMQAQSAFWLLPVLWIGVNALTQVSGHPWSRAQSALRDIETAIGRFSEDQGRLPENLTELRLQSKISHRPIQLYDSYGQRLEYAPLTGSAYLLKSFGRDGTDNTLGSPVDESILVGLEGADEGAEVSFPDQNYPHFFQSAFLDGMMAPQGPLFAKLLTRHGQGSRILIRNREQKSFNWLGSHDAVREFLWFPDGEHLLFTAEGSFRYEDGLYLWNMKTGESRNLLPDLRQKFFADWPEDKKLLLALSHVDLSAAKIYFYADRLESDDLDPALFLSTAKLYSVDTVGPTFLKAELAEAANLFDLPLDHRQQIDRRRSQKLTAAQKAWIELSFVGNVQDLLEQWQNYCAEYGTSAMFPYGIWWLATLYNDAYRELKREDGEQARIVRNYAIEISDALIGLHTAPAYLRGLAQHLKKQLLLSKPADYNVSTMRNVNSDDEAATEETP